MLLYNIFDEIAILTFSAYAIFSAKIADIKKAVRWTAFHFLLIIPRGDDDNDNLGHRSDDAPHLPLTKSHLPFQ